MNYLIDTHILLWSIFSPKKLTQEIREILINTENTIWVSKISLWEISLKYALGKLDLEGITPEKIEAVILKSGFTVLDIDSKDLLSYHQLEPMEHKDPFDRMLIWQCIRKDYMLISRDKKLKVYEKSGLKLIY